MDKTRDIVGLYVDRPQHAMILCVDEKSQVQALDRTPLANLVPNTVNLQRRKLKHVLLVVRIQIAFFYDMPLDLSFDQPLPPEFIGHGAWQNRQHGSEDRQTIHQLLRQ